MPYEHYDSFPEDAVPEGYEVFAQDTPGRVMARKPVGADTPPAKPTRKARKASPLTDKEATQQIAHHDAEMDRLASQFSWNAGDVSQESPPALDGPLPAQ